MLDGMSDSIQGSRIENLHSREVVRQSPTGLIFYYQTDWFQSTEFFNFLPFIQLNPTHPSDHTHFSVIHLQFMLYFHRPGLAAMHQTTLHTSSVYLAFQF